MPVEWVVGSCCTIIAALVGAVVFLFFQLLQREKDARTRLESQGDTIFVEMNKTLAQLAATAIASQATQATMADKVTDLWYQRYGDKEEAPRRRGSSG